MVPSERTVTVAVGHGKKAARHIDAWLRGDASTRRRRSTSSPTFDMLNPWYYSDAPKTVRPMLDLARRTSTFDEVVGGLDEDNALFEARRCLSCGNCFECDNCYGVCPDNAVIKLGPGQALRVQLRLLQGLRHLRRRVPVRRDRDGSGGRLASSRLRAPATYTVTSSSKMLQADRIGDLDLALANEEQPAGLKLRERAADRLELEPRNCRSLPGSFAARPTTQRTPASAAAPSGQQESRNPLLRVHAAEVQHHAVVVDDLAAHDPVKLLLKGWHFPAERLQDLERNHADLRVLERDGIDAGPPVSMPSRPINSPPIGIR